MPHSADQFETLDRLLRALPAEDEAMTSTSLLGRRAAGLPRDRPDVWEATLESDDEEV